MPLVVCDKSKQEGFSLGFILFSTENVYTFVVKGEGEIRNIHISFYVQTYVFQLQK